MPPIMPPAQSKIFDLQGMKDQLSLWREKGHCIVFTNGCFDILHAGHIRYLEAAAALGDHLIIGVNDDDSVRRIKGETRPIRRHAFRPYHGIASGYPCQRRGLYCVLDCWC